MKFIVAFALCVVAVSGLAVPRKGGIAADSCPYPNGTDNKIHVYNCGDSKLASYKFEFTKRFPAWPLIVKDAIVYDSNNKTMYPIDPRKPMVLDLVSVNNGVVYTDNKVHVKIYDYTPDWITGDCKWSEFPTFGLLNNIDGCDFAHNCPLQTGDLNLLLSLDLSQFSVIVNSLTAGVRSIFNNYL